MSNKKLKKFFTELRDLCNQYKVCMYAEEGEVKIVFKDGGVKLSIVDGDIGTDAGAGEVILYTPDSVEINLD